MIASESKLKGMLWLVSAILVATSFSWGFSFLVSLIPWSVERKLDSLFGSRAEAQSCVGPNFELALPIIKTIEDRLKTIDGSPAPFQFDIQFIQKNEINAFAGMAGHIFVLQGLMDEVQSPEELAGILAHEIEHVRRRHILQGIFSKLIISAFTDSTIFSSLANMHFSKGQEAEADEYGLKRLNAAQIDTNGFKNFFERMAQSNSSSALLSDHPSDASRAQMAQKYQSKNIKELIKKSDWLILKRICK